MSEYKNLTFDESFSYKGLIDVKGLYRLIDKWFKENGYTNSKFGTLKKYTKTANK